MGFLRSLLTAAVLILAPLGTAGAYFRVLAPILGFGMLLLAIGLGTLLFLISLLRMLSKKNRTGAASFQFLVGLACAGAVGFLVMKSQQHPINDLTTDFKNPPKFLRQVPAVGVKSMEGNSALLPSIERKYDQENVYKQQSAYEGIINVRTDFYAPQTFELIKQVLKEEFPEWKPVYEDKASSHIELEAESKIFHFVDDIAIEAVPAPGNFKESTVEMRSRSRAGKSDLGVNVQRIYRFTQKIRERLPSFKPSFETAPPALASLETAKAPPAQAPAAAQPQKNGARK